MSLAFSFLFSVCLSLPSPPSLFLFSTIFIFFPDNSHRVSACCYRPYIHDACRWNDYNQNVSQTAKRFELPLRPADEKEIYNKTAGKLLWSSFLLCKVETDAGSAYERQYGSKYTQIRITYSTASYVLGIKTKNLHKNVAFFVILCSSVQFHMYYSSHGSPKPRHCAISRKKWSTHGSCKFLVHFLEAVRIRESRGHRFDVFFPREVHEEQSRLLPLFILSL